MSNLNAIVRLLKASPISSIILHVDSDHHIAWVNPSALLLMKTELADFVGLSIFDVFEDPIKHGHLFEKHGLGTTLLSSLTSKTASIPVVQRYKLVERKSGGIKSHYYNCSAYPMFDDDDNVCFLVFTVQEIFRSNDKYNSTLAPLAEGIFDHPLFQNYPDAVFTLSREGKFLSANKILLDLAECSYEALTQLSFPTFIVPEEMEKVAGYFNRAINGEICNFDTEIESRKGNIRNLNVTHLPIISNREVIGVYLIAKDFTEMRRAQKALHASEQRFRVLVQEGSDMIGIVSVDGTYRYVNQTTKKVLGIPPEHFIGRNAFEFIHEADTQRIADAFQHLAEQKRIEIPPYRFVDGTGHYRWVETILTDMTNDPAVMGIVSNSRDITQRIENELKMQKSMERFDIVSKATSDAIWDFDVASGIVLWNKALKSLFGYSDTTLTREWWLERLHPDDANRVVAKITDAVNGGKTRLKNEYRFRCADDSYKNVLDRSFLIFTSSGALERIIGSMEDITERQLYIQTVEAQNQRLQEIGWTQSHLVRAPLANIMAIAELLSFEIQGEDSTRTLLSHLLKSAKDLDDIIRDIIDKTENINNFNNK